MALQFSPTPADGVKGSLILGAAGDRLEQRHGPINDRGRPEQGAEVIVSAAKFVVADPSGGDQVEMGDLVGVGDRIGGGYPPAKGVTNEGKFV